MAASARPAWKQPWDYLTGVLQLMVFVRWASRMEFSASDDDGRPNKMVQDLQEDYGKANFDELWSDIEANSKGIDPGAVRQMHEWYLSLKAAQESVLATLVCPKAPVVTLRRFVQPTGGKQNGKSRSITMAALTQIPSHPDDLSTWYLSDRRRPACAGGAVMKRQRCALMYRITGQPAVPQELPLRRRGA